MARRYGWADEILQNLDRFEEIGLEESTTVALRFAEQMTRDAHGIDAELFSALRSHFDEGEVVEIASVIGLFNYFNRFNDALEIEPTQPGDR